MKFIKNNFLVNYKFNSTLLILSNLLFIIYIFFIILIYNYNLRNALKIESAIYGIYYNDEINYFKDAIYLKEQIGQKGIISYLNGSIPDKGYYGPYNIFVLYTAILLTIGFNKILIVIISKLFFSILSFNLLISILCKLMSQKKAIILSLFLFLFSEYILINSVLLRDNIILFFFIFFFYLYTKLLNSYSCKNFLLFFIIVSILLLFRFYNIILTLPFFLYICYKNINYIKKYLFPFFILVLLVVILSYQFIDKIVWHYSISSNKWAGEYIYKTEGLPLMFYSLVYTIWGHNHTLASFQFNSLHDYFTFISYQLLHIYLIIPVILLFHNLINNKLVKKDIVFILSLFALNYVYILSYVHIFGGLVPRIYFPVILNNIFIISIFYKDYDYSYI